MRISPLQRFPADSGGVLVCALTFGAFLLVCTPLKAQDAPPRPEPPPEHVHDMQMDMSHGGGWQFTHDGVFDALFNYQGGRRSEQEILGLNWWMGMLTRRSATQELTLSAMLSADPATAGRSGYSELLQVGETLDGQPLIDRQHPHDFFMQLSASWRRSISPSTAITIAGGPVGEPALGPVAFMHRASAAAIPFAPLVHHTFDSTHVTFGVVSAGVDHGPWTLEGSVFNGREPDDNRWDFDFGKMDSVSGRIWFRPSPALALQVSSGRLVDPEPLEPGSLVRTTASAAWFQPRSTGFMAATVGYGVNIANQETHWGAFGEFSHQMGEMTMSSRLELVERETHFLLTGRSAAASRGGARTATVTAFTLAGVRRLLKTSVFEAGLGASATLNAVRDDSLVRRYGRYPFAAQIYIELRPASASRMWNMRMGSPMAHPHKL